MKDFFIADADEWRSEAWEIIRRTPQLTYQILTKRPVLLQRRLPADWGSGWPNEGFVWTNQGRNRVAGKQRRFAGALFPANLMETQSRHPSLSLRVSQGCTHHFLYH